MGDIVEVYNCLNRITAGGDVIRAMIIQSTNNGGIPKPGCQIWVRILHEVYNGPNGSGKSKWSVREADEYYSRLLLDIASHDMVRLITKEMDEGDLKTLYEASGALKSRVYRLAMTGTRMVYLSVNYSKDTPLTADQENTVNQAVEDLKRLF